MEATEVDEAKPPRARRSWPWRPWAPALPSLGVRTMREIEQVYNTTVEEMPMDVADLV